MSESSLCNPVFALALKSAFRHCLRALLPLAAVLCLAAPAGAQAPVTPNASDKTALGRIKGNNDTNSQLSGDNWTGSPITYSNANGVTWNADSPARVSELLLDAKQLTGSLSAEGMAALTLLEVQRNQLTGLDVSKNTALTHLGAGANQLTSLDVSNNIALTKLDVFGNQLTSLDVSKNTALTFLNASNNQLANLDVSKNARLTSLNVSSNQLTSLDVSKNTALTDLDVQYNQLTSLDVSNNTKLTGLRASNNQLTSLDVSNNTALTLLAAGNNQLTDLDVSTNTALQVLLVGYNQLAKLDVSKNTALINLGVGSNQLTDLDVSNNTALASLTVQNNQLASLNVIKNTLLGTLDASNNQLAKLDVSKNARLTSLNVSSNHLTSLNVSANPRLTNLYASNNQLANLDVSQNTALVWLEVQNNQLTNLDVSQNADLVRLHVSGNPLSALDLSGLNQLVILGIAETNLKLSGLNLPIPGQLIRLDVDPGQLAQENFSALTSLTNLGLYSRTATAINLPRNSSLPQSQITYLGINAPQARSLDFSNYAPALTELHINPGRLERVTGAAGLDRTKFSTLTIKNNRLPLSQLAPLVGAVDPTGLTSVSIDPQSKVGFETMASRNKPFDLSSLLATERTLLGKNTVFRLLPASAVITHTDGSVKVNANQVLTEGADYTLDAAGNLKITKSGAYYLLMTNPALYNWGAIDVGEIIALSGLLQYQARLYAELAALSGNPNAYRLAQGLDWAVDNNKSAALQAMLAKIDNAATDGEALYYMNQLHGESVASAVQYFAFNMKNLFRVMDGFAMTPGDNVILDGSAAPAAGDGDYAAHLGQPWRVKLRLTGDWSNMDGHDGYYGYDGRSFGGALALERDITEGYYGRFTLGFAGAFSHSEVDFDNYDNEGDSDDWAMAVYGRYQYADWFAGARVGYGQSAASVERHLPSLGLTANSDQDIDYYSAALFTGYDFYFGDGSWRLTPVAGVNWLRASADAFDEVGAGDYNLSYDADDYDSLELLANLTLAKRFEFAGGAALTPRINAGIGYETADRQVSMRSTFGDIPDFPHFGVDSPDVGRARLLAGAGIDWHVTDHVDLSLEYQGSFQEDYDDHMGLASFKVSW